MQTGKIPANYFERRFVNSQGQIIRDILDVPTPFYTETMENSAVCSYLKQDGERIAYFQILENHIALPQYHIQLMELQRLTGLPIAFRQAKFALEYQSGPGYYACRDYALQYFLKNLQAQDMVVDLLHPAIAALAEYDRRNQTQLLQTLRIFMKCDRNQLDTAALLHAHRNTIKYRLERISQLTQIDYNSCEERNYLNLSLMCDAPGEWP